MGVCTYTVTVTGRNIIWRFFFRGEGFTNYVVKKKQIVQKYRPFVNVYKEESVNARGQVVKEKTKSCQRSFEGTLLSNISK